MQKLSFVRAVAGAFLVCSAGLSAQQNPAIFPSDHANVPNGATNASAYPFSWGTSRIMGIYDSWDLIVPSGTSQITKIGFRQDGNRQSTGNTLLMRVLLGETDNTSANTDRSFDQNYLPGTETEVFFDPNGPNRAKAFVMPDMGNPTNPNPDGNVIWVPLDAPYTFNPNKNLVMEFQIFGNNVGGQSFPYYLDRARFHSPIVAGVAGCPHSGGTALMTTSPTKVGGTWRATLSGAPSSAPAILAVSLRGLSQTPVPLANLTGLSLPASCQIQVPVGPGLQLFFAATSASGRFTWTANVPSQRLMAHNVKIASQAFVFDFFSPGGGALSNADQATIGIDPAMTAVTAQGNPATTTTGGVYPNYGMVTLFEFQ